MSYLGEFQAASGGMPAGVVLPYASGAVSAPVGYFFCNGAAVSRTNYAELFAVVGVAHGSGDGSTTFNLPDYRGRFIRGRDNAAGRDPSAGSRTAAATGGNTGDAVGSVQGEATKKNGLTASAASSSVSGSTGTGSTGTGTSGTKNSNVSHSHSVDYNPVGGNQVFPGAMCQGSNFYRNTGGSGGVGTTSTNTDHTHNIPALSIPSLSISGTAAAQAITIGAGDAETRPLNAYVNYIIKY